MTEPWIRVHANLHAKPVIARAVASLGVSENEAIGLMVRFWGSVSQHVINGDVQDVTDRQMELWAGWTRKRGRFAGFVRAHHLDTDGRVNEWDEYAGKLEARRANDRARKEAERQRKSRGRHADSPQDVTSDSVPTRANEDETVRNETETTSSSAAPVWQPIAEQRLSERLTSDAGRLALAAVLAVSDSKAGVVSLFMAMLDGMHPPVVRPEHLDAALIDYVANGMSSGRFNSKHFRHFTRRAAESTQPDSRRPSNTERALRAVEGL